MGKWWKANYGQVAAFSCIVFVVAWVAAMLTGKFGFLTKQDAEGWYGHAVAIIGVGLGAGLAIGWSIIDRSNNEARKRRAFGTSFHLELNFNRTVIQYLRVHPTAQLQLNSFLLNRFNEHAELFTGPMVVNVHFYRIQLESLKQTLAETFELDGKLRTLDFVTKLIDDLIRELVESDSTSVTTGAGFAALTLETAGAGIVT